MNKHTIGKTLLIALHFFVLLLVGLYVVVASSILPDNLFHVPYEPSGMQMIYYMYSFPLFLIARLIHWITSVKLNIRKIYALNFMLIWSLFFCLFIYVDQVIHISNGLNLLYRGSLLIALISVGLLAASLFLQLKDITHVGKD
jgi:hypothetical protein